MFVFKLCCFHHARPNFSLFHSTSMAVLAALWNKEGKSFNVVTYILELCVSSGDWGGGGVSQWWLTPTIRCTSFSLK